MTLGRAAHLLVVHILLLLAYPMLLLIPLLSGCFHEIAATGSLVVESLSDHDILTGVCSEGVGGTSCTDESSLEPTEIVLSTPTPLLPDLVEFDYEKYEAGQYIDAFFARIADLHEIVEK